jgi:hypothetical protein
MKKTTIIAAIGGVMAVCMMVPASPGAGISTADPAYAGTAQDLCKAMHPNPSLKKLEDWMQRQATAGLADWQIVQAANTASATICPDIQPAIDALPDNWEPKR